MPYTISEALTFIPGFKKGYYEERGRERVRIGEERWLDFNNIPFAYNDTWFGRERLRCKCLNTYKDCSNLIRVECGNRRVNKRNDFLQKESTRLVRENQTIAIESLNLKGMVRNHRLAKAISSVSWGRFFAMLEYKAAWYGNTIIRVPAFYPSSQTCSKCGSVNPLVKNLSVREWECPFCHAKHDRDYNASINILNKGLSLA